MNELYISDRVHKGIHIIMPAKSFISFNLTSDLLPFVHINPKTLPNGVPVEILGSFTDDEWKQWTHRIKRNQSSWTST